MAKKILRYLLRGILWGSTIFLFHGIWWDIGDFGSFYHLHENFTLHAVGFLIFGVVLSGSSILLEVERLGEIQKTILHALILACSWLVVGYVFGWIIDASLTVIIMVVLQFTIIYFAFWTASYLREKRQLNKINDALRKRDMVE